ncbi:MAG TPA: TRAFs-binding domain-containing protein [Blastocatellia bacterium]|nr:TRAFs-binding domain-containing protein [Blastocatellia bacterium]
MKSKQQGKSNSLKRCFVVMGFGVKTDYATGRKLDLDKSYRLLIRPVVEEKGLICKRADEIRHSGAIDVPMYQELLTADIVIADLSTANPNALYELGIRHALRPKTTIVISENQLPYPFDLNHIKITSYIHLGDAIDFDEVVRFRQVLGDTIEAVLQDQGTDSPVYTFLSKLVPPSLAEQAEQAVKQAEQALERAGEAINEAGIGTRDGEIRSSHKSLAEIIEEGEQAIQDSRFSDAKNSFAQAMKFRNSGIEGYPNKPDPYLVQRFVLTTYKAKEPDEISALTEALSILDSQLGLKKSNDPETVGLAGAIEKRLFEKGQGVEHLNKAIRYYAQGYYLSDDRYNAINLAYLLNVRTDSLLDSTKEYQIADLVMANRIRLDVLPLCQQELQEIRSREKRQEAIPDGIKEGQEANHDDQKYWCLATKAEAHFGLGEMDSYEATRAEALALAPPAWMVQTFDKQIAKLRGLLEKHGHLLNPPWPGRAV